MNAKRLTVLFTLFTLLLSACAPAAQETDVAVEKTVVVTQAVLVEGETVVETVIDEVLVEVEVEPVEAIATAAPISQEPAPIQPMPTPAPTMAAPGTVPTPSSNFFEDYGVNPYVDTYEDHYSTFALDVDTASYSVARRYVRDGNIPPAEAIRVEEFVNYFDQGYPVPPDVAFGLYADGAPSPFHYDGTTILRFGVQGYQVPEWQRDPLVLTFVIDVSGSMDMENRLGLVEESLNLLVDRLRPDDAVAIVVYGSEARVVLYPTRGDDRSTILSAIYSLRPEGSTNAEAGLSLGYQIAMQAYQPGASNRVILCSDGVANVGNTGPDAILENIRGYVSEGIYLTTVGFGMGNFNDVLMEQLADNGNGNYAYVDTLDEAEKLFVEDLTSTLQVIALDAKVQVDFNTDVVAYYRLIGYENRAVADEDFRDDTVDAGEIGAGHSATALYAVQFRPGVSGRIATVQLRWEDPDTHEVREINGNFNTWDLAANFNDASPYFRLAVLVAHYAEVLRQSPWAQEITMTQVFNLASPLSEYFPGNDEVLEFIDLVYQASLIMR